MTDHVHELVLDYQLGAAYWRCMMDNCTHTISPIQATALINAAQVLNTKRALRIAELIEEIGNSIDGEGGGKTTKVLRSYAKTRGEL